MKGKISLKIQNYENVGKDINIAKQYYAFTRSNKHLKLYTVRENYKENNMGDWLCLHNFHAKINSPNEKPYT